MIGNKVTDIKSPLLEINTEEHLRSQTHQDVREDPIEVIDTRFGMSLADDSFGPEEEAPESSISGTGDQVFQDAMRKK